MKLSKSFIVVLLVISLCSIQARHRTTIRVADAQSSVQFARLAYCNAEQILGPNCDVCRQMAALGFAVEKAHTYEKIIDNHKVVFTMTISKEINGQQLVISFGGPKTAELIHIQSLYSSGFITINNNKVEKGFWDIYTGAIKNDLAARLAILNYSDLIFVGHSVGGSMAVLAAYDVAASNSGPKPHVFVYGALTVGDDNFINHFKTLADVVRIKKNQDLYSQFPTCLLTGIESSICFEDYSTLYSRYPFYRPYLSGAYPFLHGSGYWSSPFFNSYIGNYLPYGSHYGYGGYSSYPDQFMVDGRDDPQQMSNNVVHNQGAQTDKPPQAEPIPLLNNKKGNSKGMINANSPTSQSPQNSMTNSRATTTVTPTTVNPTTVTPTTVTPTTVTPTPSSRIEDEASGSTDLSSHTTNQNTLTPTTTVTPTPSSRIEDEASGSTDLSSHKTNQKGRSNTRENQKSFQDMFGSTSSRINGNHDNYEDNMHDSSARNVRNSRTESYNSPSTSEYSNSVSSSGFSNSVSSGNSRARNRRSDSSTDSSFSSFLETGSKKRSSTRMRRAYRKAFTDYFTSFDNCKVNGKSANCQVDPNVHKTYYGIDIENCY